MARRPFPAEIPWISFRKHVLNVWPVGICREEAEAQMLYSGESQDLSLYQTTLSGWQHSNIVVRFVAIPKLYHLFVRQHQCLWPINQKAANTCFHIRHGWTSKLRAPGSSFGTSLGPVMNFPCSFSQIASTQYHPPKKQGYDFSFCSYLCHHSCYQHL